MEQLKLIFDRTTESYTEAELALLTPVDIYQCADKELLQRLKEDRRLERKPATIHAGVLGEYFSMWANTIPDGGLVVLGQEDSGIFSGCVRLNADQINNLEKSGEFHCPEASWESKRVAVALPDGALDFVVLIHVHYHPTKVVHDIKGRVYVRLADTAKKLSTNEVRDLEIVKGQVDLEQEPVNLVYPGDFKLPLIRQYVDAVVRSKKLLQTHSDIEILSHGRLGKIRDGSFVPNVACALLFSKDPCLIFPGCKIRLLRFDGETEKGGENYNAVKDFFLEGPIPEIIVDAAEKLRSQLREFSHLDADNRFYSTSEYPESAWYEAIVNACVHRSYVLKNMVTFVKMFDDKLVIESPGGFPPPVTPATIYETHSPRNPHLMNALFFMSFVKCHNEGTRRMRDSMDANNLPKPDFSQKEVASGYNSVRVTLRNNVSLRKLWIDKEASRVLALASWKDLDKTELRILNYVAEHGSINVTQTQKLVQAAKNRWHSLKKLLDSMVSRGLLVHHHSKVVTRDSRSCYKLPESKDKEPEVKNI